MDKGLILKNCAIVTMDSEDRVIKCGAVWIENGKIKAIGDFAPEMEISSAEIIDLKGMLVTPGFVNSHNHLSMSLFRNYADDMKLMDWLFTKVFPMEDKLNAKTAKLGAQLSLCEMIRSGTTTSSDMYFFMDQVAEAFGESGIKGALSRGLQGDDGKELDYRLAENIELFDKYNNSFDGRIKVMLGPHSVYTCTPEYLRKIAKYSDDIGIPIQIHLSETKDEVSNCINKYAVTPIQLAFDCGLLKKTTVVAHGVYLNDREIELLKFTGASVSHNPGSNMKLASGIAPITKLISKGVNVALGTDGAASNNKLDMMQEIRLATYLQKVNSEDPTALPLNTVLKMATINGAKALGFEKTGKIKEGWDADLVIFDTEKANWYPKHNNKSALVYSASSGDIESVMVRGKFVMKNRVLLTMDEERILHDVAVWMEKGAF